MSVVSTVSKYLGTPYVYGGSSPSGFDCSGLMQYAFAQNGITIPRRSQEQFNFTANSRITNMDDLQSGDLVFFKSTGTASAPGHVGIYVGNGQYIHAPRTGDVVKVSNLSDRSDFVGGGRVSGGASGNLSTVSTEDNTLSIVGKIVAAICVILLCVLAVVFFGKAFNYN